MINTIQYRIGDATNPEPETGVLFCLLQVNNDIGVYGAGLSGAISARYPEVERAYRDLKEYVGGTVGFVKVESRKDLVVCNMIAQCGVRRPGNLVPFQPDWFEKCLEKVAQHVVLESERVICISGRLGAGLAGGNWEEIEKMLIENLYNKGIQVRIYDLP